MIVNLLAGGNGDSLHWNINKINFFLPKVVGRLNKKYSRIYYGE